jgi:hypothetical protein
MDLPVQVQGLRLPVPLEPTVVPLWPALPRTL